MSYQVVSRQPRTSLPPRLCNLLANYFRQWPFGSRITALHLPHFHVSMILISASSDCQQIVTMCVVFVIKPLESDVHVAAIPHTGYSMGLAPNGVSPGKSRDSKLSYAGRKYCHCLCARVPSIGGPRTCGKSFRNCLKQWTR